MKGTNRHSDQLGFAPENNIGCTVGLISNLLHRPQNLLRCFAGNLAAFPQAGQNP